MNWFSRGTSPVTIEKVELSSNDGVFGFMDGLWAEWDPSQPVSEYCFGEWSLPPGVCGAGGMHVGDEDYFRVNKKVSKKNAGKEKNRKRHTRTERKYDKFARSIHIPSDGHHWEAGAGVRWRFLD